MSFTSELGSFEPGSFVIVLTWGESAFWRGSCCWGADSLTCCPLVCWCVCVRGGWHHMPFTQHASLHLHKSKPDPIPDQAPVSIWTCGCSCTRLGNELLIMELSAHHICANLSECWKRGGCWLSEPSRSHLHHLLQSLSHWLTSFYVNRT